MRERTLRRRPLQMNEPAWSLGLLALILLVALFFRLYRLDAVPPGLTHDEADTGYFVLAVYQGAPSQVKAPYGYANEPFTMYSGALFMALFGPTDLALRLHSAFFGLVLLIFTYLWTRYLFGRAVGLGSAAMVAVSFWAVSTSRFALNPEPAPALFTGAVYFLWLALGGQEGNRGRRWAWVPFALLLAGSLYAYEVARAVSLSLGLLFAHLALVDRPRFRRHGAWFAGALAAAGVLAAPHLLDPDAWQRSSSLAGPLTAALRGDLRPLLTNAVETLGTLSIRGDSFVTYNLPGRPILDPVASLFFYIGILLCLRRWRRPAYAFVLMWVATGLLPSLIVGEWTSTLHSMGAEAPILTLPVLGAVEVGRRIQARFGPRWAGRFALACGAWLVVMAISTGYDYFVRWGESPAVRAAYFHNLAAITDYLNESPYSGTVTLSSPFPEVPLDPFIADLRVQRDDLTLRWFDARRALLFPDVDRSLLILPTNAPLAPRLADWVPLSPPERVLLRPDDVDPYFDVHLWNPRRAWAVLLPRLTGQQVAGDRPLTLPVNFGGAVALVGYTLESPTVAPGGTVSLITAWQVFDPEALGPLPPQRYGRAAAIFVHLLDSAGQVVGQEDRLDVPAWNWQSGDRFLQIHRFSLKPDLPAGRYALEVGLYTRPDLTRLPILTDQGPAGDRIFLQPVEVTVP